MSGLIQHQLKQGPLPPHGPSLVTFLKQLAQPVASLLTAGNQEAGLCARD